MNTIKVKLISFLLFNCISSFAQISFIKSFNGVHAHSVQQTSDQGYIFAGSLSYNSIYLVKTDINGDSLWTKSYGGIGYDDSYSVSQTPDSGFIIAGVTNSSGAGGNDA